MPIKILRPKALLVFFLALTISLTAATLTFSLLYSFNRTLTSALSGLTEDTLMMQTGSKSIYTSRIPAAISEGLNRIPGVKAEPMTLTITVVRGEPIVVRGVYDPSEYSIYLVEGKLPKEGAWLILGEKAQRRVGLEIGDVVFLSSATSSNIIPMLLTGIYATGDLRDYEAIVSFSTGLILGGLTDGLASIIVVDGLSPNEIERITSSTYYLTVDYEEAEGQITILDSSANPTAFFKVNGTGSKTLALPFGYYTITFQSSYITANVSSLLLNENSKASLGELTNREVTLKVLGNPNVQPILKTEDGKMVTCDWRIDGWYFTSRNGLHTLSIGNTSYIVPLVGDTIFEPQRRDTLIRNVKVHVYWRDGSPVRDYLVTLWNTEGKLVFSTTSAQPDKTLVLADGEYSLEISKPPYTIKTIIRVPTQEDLVLEINALPFSHTFPLTLFQGIRADAPFEISSLILNSLLGVTTSTLTAVTLTLVLLSTSSVFAVDRGLHCSIKDNLQILRYLGMGRKEALKILGPSTLSLALAAGALSTMLVTISYMKLGSELQFTILGYGLENQFYHSLAYTIVLSVVLWAISMGKIILSQQDLER